MVNLCDVTIRESEQLPGRSYTLEQKIDAGRALDSLSIPLIQAGFPVIGETEQQAVQILAETLSADVVAIARAKEEDVNAALAANADIVEIFAPLSDRHLTATVATSRETMLAQLRAAVDRATASGATVHLTIMDAFRTDLEHLQMAYDRFDDVDCLGLADTVGASPPHVVEALLDTLMAEGADPTRLGVHFHDDLGVATANALVAAQRDIGRIDVSVASFGERAGNPSLEEIVVLCDQDDSTTLDLQANALIPTCQRVLSTLKESVDDRKAILGKDVFEHESGLHTAAMLRDPSTFEPFDPATYGADRSLVFGAGTGTGAARELFAQTGRNPTDERIHALLSKLDREGPVDLETALELARSLD